MSRYRPVHYSVF